MTSYPIGDTNQAVAIGLGIAFSSPKHNIGYEILGRRQIRAWKLRSIETLSRVTPI
jgi:hypothetical protein